MRKIASLSHYIRVVGDYVRMFGPAGVPYLAEAVIFKRRRLVRVRSHWAPHPIFLRLATSDIDVFRQVFMEQEYNVSNHIQTTVCTIFDAGANIGLTSIFFANRYPYATIVAIEPERGNYDMLTLNCKPYPHVHCVYGALWGADGPLHIQSDDVRDCSFSVEAASSSDAPLQGHRVSTLLDEFGMNTLSILKMDIEGSEVEVFSDSDGWSQRVENIIVELHDRKRPGCTEAFRAATCEVFAAKATTQELTLATRV